MLPIHQIKLLSTSDIIYRTIDFSSFLTDANIDESCNRTLYGSNRVVGISTAPLLRTWPGSRLYKNDRSHRCRHSDSTLWQCAESEYPFDVHGRTNAAGAWMRPRPTCCFLIASMWDAHALAVL